MRRSKRRVVVRVAVVPPLMYGVCKKFEKKWGREVGTNSVQRCGKKHVLFVGNTNKVTGYIAVCTAGVSKLFTLSVLYP